MEVIMNFFSFVYFVEIIIHTRVVSLFALRFKHCARYFAVVFLVLYRSLSFLLRTRDLLFFFCVHGKQHKLFLVLAPLQCALGPPKSSPGQTLTFSCTFRIRSSNPFWLTVTSAVKSGKGFPPTSTSILSPFKATQCVVFIFTLSRANKKLPSTSWSAQLLSGNCTERGQGVWGGDGGGGEAGLEVSECGSCGCEALALSP